MKSCIPHLPRSFSVSFLCTGHILCPTLVAIFCIPPTTRPCSVSHLSPGHVLYPTYHQAMFCIIPTVESCLISKPVTSEDCYIALLPLAHVLELLGENIMLVLYPVPCTLYPVPCTLYPVPCTLYQTSAGAGCAYRLQQHQDLH